MVLTPHALAGTAAAMIFRHHPVLAFFAAFASHFVVDAIPHWHYPLRSLGREHKDPMDDRIAFGRRFLRDVFVVGFDAVIGVAVSLGAAYLLFPQHLGVAALGVFGGIIPDFLQFVSYVFPNSPLRYLQNFHARIHAKKRLDKTPISGIAYQLAFAALCIVLLKYF